MSVLNPLEGVKPPPGESPRRADDDGGESAGVSLHQDAQGILREALGSVKFKPSEREFFEAVYCGVAAGPRMVFDTNLTRLAATYKANPGTLFVYRGVQPSTKSMKASHHFHINPFDPPFVLKVRPDFRTARGLTDEGISTFVVACCEVDEDESGNPMSFTNQVELYEGLHKRGLPYPNALVMSGDDRGADYDAPDGEPGKSLHAFWALTPDTTFEEWLEIQESLIALLRADVAIRSRGHRMRVGGVKALQWNDGSALHLADHPRYQTLLFSHTTPVKAADMTAVLRRALAADGIDRHVAMKALLLANQMKGRASRYRNLRAAGHGDVPAEAIPALLEECVAVRRTRSVTQRATELLATYPALHEVVVRPGTPPKPGRRVIERTGTDGRMIHVAVEVVEEQWDRSAMLFTHHVNAVTSDTATAEELFERYARSNGLVSNVTCELHDDAHPSAFLGRSRGGRPFMECPVCGRWWARSLPAHDDYGNRVGAEDTIADTEGRGDDHDENHTPPTATPASLTEAGAPTSSVSCVIPINGSQDNVYARQAGGGAVATTAGGAARPPVVAGVPVEYIHEANLPPLQFRAKFMFVRSPMGTGKTLRELEWLKANPDVSALVVTCRKALCDSLHGRMPEAGFTNYLDVDGTVDASRVVMCVNSIPFRLPATRVYDCVLIEEPELVFKHLFSGTIPNPDKVVRRLASLFTEAKHVLLADADLGDITLGTARILNGGRLEDAVLVANEFLPPVEYRVYDSIPDLDAFVEAGLARCEHLYVYSTSKKEAKRLARHVRSGFPSARLLLIDGDEVSSSACRAFMKQPDAHARRYDVVIASPSVCSGVSINIDGHFDRVVGYGVAGSHSTAEELLQGLHRVRQPRDRVRHLFLDPTELHDIAAPQRLARLEHEMIAFDQRETQRFDAAFEFSGREAEVYRRANAMTANLKVLVDTVRARSYNRLRHNALLLLEQRGACVTFAERLAPEESASREVERRADLVAIDDEYFDRIVVAPDLGPDEVRELRRRRELDPDQQAILKRAEMRALYGVGIDIDTDRVRAFLRGHEKETVEAFAWWVEATAGHAKLLAEHHVATVERAGRATALRWMALTRARAAILGQGYGIKSLADLRADRSLARPSGMQLEWLASAQCGGFCLALGLRHPSNIMRAPFHLLGDVLGQMGIDGASRQARVKHSATVMDKTAKKDNREYVYRVDAGSVEKMLALSDRLRAKLVFRDEEGPSDLPDPPGPTLEEIEALAGEPDLDDAG